MKVKDLIKMLSTLNPEANVNASTPPLMSTVYLHVENRCIALLPPERIPERSDSTDNSF